MAGGGLMEMLVRAGGSAIVAWGLPGWSWWRARPSPPCAC